MRRLEIAFLALGWAWAGCSSSGGRVCEPGWTTGCTDSNGQGGTHTCLADGSGFGPCVGCQPDCGARVCGEAPNGCGTCGTCPTGQTCDAAGQCLGCQPACGARECGPDPICGTSCGECDAPDVCSAQGACECAPACGGRECGPEPACGTSCGTCQAPAACNPQGLCVCAPDCAGLACGPDPVCGQSCGSCQAPESCTPQGQCVCAPACDGRACGGDGCGGSCGACDPGAGEVCVEATGQCLVCAPDCQGRECGLEEACGSLCGTCPAGEVCDASGQCQCAPDCQGRACGDDGCGGSCGACDPAGQYCTPEHQCAAIPAGMCLDGDAIRAPRPPVPGAVVINEFMADPAAVPDATGEWLELYVAEDFDLNGLELGRTPQVVLQTVSSATCLPAPAGGRVVLARTADPVENGGLPRVDALLGALSLPNSGAQGIFVGYQGELLDAITYSSTAAGVSTSLDPTRRTPEANDQADSWCRTPAGVTYGAGDRGTPGAANPSCGIVTPGMCLEGDSERPKIPPQVGDLVINEFMANPRAVSDTDGEWFEVFVARDVDLNGLQVGRVPGTVDLTLPEGACRRVVAGAHLLFARRSDPLVNGGLPPVDVLIGFSLINSNGSLFVGLAGEVLDRITWASAGDGVATSLEPVFQNPVDNDDPLAWCPALDEYGPGSPPDRGTPGAANPSCP